MSKRRRNDRRRGQGKKRAASGGAEAGRRRGGKGRPAKLPSRERIEEMRQQLLSWRLPGFCQVPVVELVRQICLHTRAPGVTVGYLLARSGDEEISELAQVALSIVAIDPRVPEKVRGEFLADALPHLRSAFEDRSVEDRRRYQIGCLLRICGVELTGEEMRSRFQDLDAVERAQHEWAARRPRSEALSEQLHWLSLYGFEGLPYPDVGRGSMLRSSLDFTLNRVETNPAADGVLALTILAFAQQCRVEMPGMSTAMARLESLRHPRVVWALDELARWPGMGELGELARAAAERLESIGLEGQPPPALRFASGTSTGVDGRGSRGIYVFLHTADGGLDCLTLMSNLNVGIKDAYMIFGKGTTVQDLIGKQMLPATCDLDRTRELVADALWVHEQERRPVPGSWLLLRPLLGPEPIVPAPLQPRLGAYMLETMTPSTELVAGTEHMLEGLYDDLWCATDSAYDFVRRHLKRRWSAGGFPLSNEDFERYLVDVVAPEREKLRRIIGLELDQAVHAGRARHTVHRLAARVYRCLADDGLAIGDIPYVRALEQRGVARIADNLDQGYPTQEAANRAAARMQDDLPDDLIDILREDPGRIAPEVLIDMLYSCGSGLRSVDCECGCFGDGDIDCDCGCHED